MMPPGPPKGVVPAGPGPIPCPYCHHPADRSPELLREFNLIVLFCRRCKLFSIEGDVNAAGALTWYGRHNSPGGIPKHALLNRANEIGRQAAARETLDAVMTTDITDERWEGGMIG